MRLDRFIFAYSSVLSLLTKRESEKKIFIVTL